MFMIKVFIDADNCVKKVLQYVLKTAPANKVKTILVSNKRVKVPNFFIPIIPLNASKDQEDSSDSQEDSSGNSQENVSDTQEAVNAWQVIVKKESNAADNYILLHATTSSLVITRDILFAKKLVDKGVLTMNDKGYIFTASTIQERLTDRNLNYQLSCLGLNGNKAPSYNEKDFVLFIKNYTNCLKRLFDSFL